MTKKHRTNLAVIIVCAGSVVIGYGLLKEDAKPMPATLPKVADAKERKPEDPRGGSIAVGSMPAEMPSVSPSPNRAPQPPADAVVETAVVADDAVADELESVLERLKRGDKRLALSEEARDALRDFAATPVVLREQTDVEELNETIDYVVEDYADFFKWGNYDAEQEAQITKALVELEMADTWEEHETAEQKLAGILGEKGVAKLDLYDETEEIRWDVGEFRLELLERGKETITEDQTRQLVELIHRERESRDIYDDANDAQLLSKETTTAISKGAEAIITSAKVLKSFRKMVRQSERWRLDDLDDLEEDPDFQ